MPTQHRSPDRALRLSAGWECRRSCQRNFNANNDSIKVKYYKEPLLVTDIFNMNSFSTPLECIIKHIVYMYI